LGAIHQFGWGGISVKTYKKRATFEIHFLRIALINEANPDG
tara:strand:+ start:608 stop:730 length:123 start_codon:yes stop_codon:yes gene_type:complete